MGSVWWQLAQRWIADRLLPKIVGGAGRDRGIVFQVDYPPVGLSSRADFLVEREVTGLQFVGGESAAALDATTLDAPTDDPPDIHDALLLTVGRSDSTLRLLLRWRAYSKEQPGHVQNRTGWLSLLDVTDIDARPAEDDLKYVPARLRGIDRFANRLLRTYDLNKVGTARRLIADLTVPRWEMGEPLDMLDALPTGYVLKTKLIGAYFIQSSASALAERVE